MARRKGQKLTRFLPFRRIVKWLTERECLLECGHRWKVFHWVPKIRAGCEPCWFEDQAKAPGLHTYWFARIGRKNYRAFRWGDLMYEADIQATGIAHVDTLLIVRAETLSWARKTAMTTHKFYPAERTLWRGLTPSRTRRRTARSACTTSVSGTPSGPSESATTPSGTPSSG